MKKHSTLFWMLAASVLLLAGFLRFHGLEDTASRSDELNQIHYVLRNQPVAELWIHPPWTNQIPLADSIPVLWARCQPWRQAGERLVREPFALLGWLSVLACMVWCGRRCNPESGLLAGLWMALAPFHVYHSREAYYYAPTLFCGALMLIAAMDSVLRLRRGKRVAARGFVWMGGTMLLAGLCHMSVWAVAGGAWLWVAIEGWRKLAGAERRRHLWGMGWIAVGVGAGLSRWVFRALWEMHLVATGATIHTGSPTGAVLPYVLPLFAGGRNAVGWVLLLALGAGAVVAWRHGGKPGRTEGGYPMDAYRVLCEAMVGSVGLVYLYIIVVSGGKAAKWAYFSVSFPAFAMWAGATVDAVLSRCSAPKRRFGDAVAAAMLLLLLAWPAWEVTRVEGKPTPYYALRAWLDGNLTEGDVAVVDRWLEPWNEMALYAPEKVNVGFTVPDEPYEQYVANDWRGVTKRFFEQNGAQAFIRLARNHADRMGVWKWPESWFAHRSVVTNAAGLRLAKTGFAPMEEFYLNPSRVEVEIFWDTHEEAAEKQFARGAESAVFFGGGWRLFKPWQQGDFRDYRILGDGKGVVEVWRPAGAEKKKCRVLVTGTTVGGEATVKAGRGGLMRFRPGEISTQVFEETLGGGRNGLEFAGVQGPGRLAALEVRVE